MAGLLPAPAPLVEVPQRQLVVDDSHRGVLGSIPLRQGRQLCRSEQAAGARRHASSGSGGSRRFQQHCTCGGAPFFSSALAPAASPSSASACASADTRLTACHASLPLSAGAPPPPPPPLPPPPLLLHRAPWLACNNAAALCGSPSFAAACSTELRAASEEGAAERAVSPRRARKQSTRRMVTAVQLGFACRGPLASANRPAASVAGGGRRPTDQA